MHRIAVILAAVVLAAGLAVQEAGAQIVPVSPSEAAQWMRYLVPLPRQIDISGKAVLDPSSVAVYTPANPDIVVSQAKKELWESMGLSGANPNPPSPSFTVTFQIGGSESVPLQSLKNSDQAYRIFPETGSTGLRIVALASRGIYYGCKTVQQLIAAYYLPGSVQMPLLTVTDWPELRDRGVWGNDSYNRTRWMADRKMNYQEQLAARWFDASCIGHAGPKSGGYDKIYTEGPYYGLEPCHAILHLEQNSGTGMFTCYPILVAVNGVSGAWCYTRPVGSPAAVDVLGWWIADLKNLPYCNDVDVWMSESVSTTQGCKCATCSVVNRNVLEARTIVLGWKRAMQTAGPMGLRILTSEVTRNDNDLIVAELQSDPSVKIWHYDSLKTYMVSEMQIVDPDIASWASSGKYGGVVPLLSPTSRAWSPWTGPQFVRYRMQEFKNKSLSGFMGYPTPGIAYYRFNTEAAAEWSWNPDGRSAREFALSWAVREGLPDPEMFADWCDLMGPVSWDVYGSEFPRGILRNNANCGPIATALVNGTLPALGTFKSGLYPAPWGDIKNITQFNNDVSNACKALELAKQMNIPEFTYESLVVHGYITALRALYELKSLVVNGSVAPANRPAAANYFYIYVSGMKQAKDALPKWENAVVGGSAATAETVTIMDNEISQMTSLASSLGCPISSPTTLVPVTSIPAAKKSADGTFVTLGAEVVTSASNGTYIQEAGGPPAGIKVQTSLAMTAGSPVTVIGQMGTSNGERCVNATMVIPRTSSDAVKPVGIRTSSIGGAAYGLQPAVWEYRKEQPGTPVQAQGLNNTGVMVKAAGRVTAQGADYFYIDDGSGCSDGSGNVGIRVICGSITKPSVNTWVMVTGISSTYYDRGRTWRALVAPTASHIVPV